MIAKKYIVLDEQNKKKQGGFNAGRVFHGIKFDKKVIFNGIYTIVPNIKQILVYTKKKKKNTY